MQTDQLIKNTIVTQVTIVLFGTLVWFVSSMVSNYFANSDLVERVTALEGRKLDTEIYRTDIEPMKNDIREMKQDIKTLLSRKQVYLDNGATIE